MSEIMHSPIGGSRARRLINCAGSTAMESISEDYKDPKYRNEGNMAHHMGDFGLKNNLTEAAFKTSVFSEPFPQYVNEAMYDHVWAYIEFCRSLYVDGALWGSEVSVDLNWLYSNAFGTSDWFTGIPGGWLTVADLKYGVGTVEYFEQLKYYSLGILERDNPNGYTMVRMIYYQPRGLSGTPYRYEDISVADLYAWGHGVLKPAMEKTQSADAYLCAGDWCGFCKADYWCSEFKRKAFQNALIEFGVGSDFSPPDAKEVDSVHLAYFMDNVKSLKKYITSMEEYTAFRALKKGDKIPGYKKIEAIGNSCFKKPEHAEFILELAHGERVYKPRQLQTLTELKKFVSKETMNGLTHRPKTGFKLVPESHKAPEYKGAGDDFGVKVI